MEKRLPELLLKAVGLSCCEIHIGYGGILCFGLGNKVYHTHPRQKDRFRGEWDIRSYSGAWRLVNGPQIVCGSFDSEEESEPELQILVGKKLVDISQTSPFDVSFDFGNDLRVDFLGQSGFDNYLEILLPGDVNLELKDGKWTQFSSSERIAGLTKEEQMIRDYSEECRTRWQGLVPPERSTDYCKECAYFHPIVGRFYFWEYGLCSNGSSAFDGKVVGVMSGCEQFNSSLPTVER